MWIPEPIITDDAQSFGATVYSSDRAESGISDLDDERGSSAQDDERGSSGEDDEPGCSHDAQERSLPGETSESNPFEKRQRETRPNWEAGRVSPPPKKVGRPRKNTAAARGENPVTRGRKPAARGRKPAARGRKPAASGKARGRSPVARGQARGRSARSKEPAARGQNPGPSLAQGMYEADDGAGSSDEDSDDEPEDTEEHNPFGCPREHFIPVVPTRTRGEQNAERFVAREEERTASMKASSVRTMNTGLC
jgi:hypothetical protein